MCIAAAVTPLVSHCCRYAHGQYCRSAGHPALVAELAKTYTAELGYEVNALKDVRTLPPLDSRQTRRYMR